MKDKKRLLPVKKILRFLLEAERRLWLFRRMMNMAKAAGDIGIWGGKYKDYLTVMNQWKQRIRYSCLGLIVLLGGLIVGLGVWLSYFLNPGTVESIRMGVGSGNGESLLLLLLLLIMISLYRNMQKQQKELAALRGELKEMKSLLERNGRLSFFKARLGKRLRMALQEKLAKQRELKGESARSQSEDDIL